MFATFVYITQPPSLVTKDEPESPLVSVNSVPLWFVSRTEVVSWIW